MNNVVHHCNCNDDYEKIKKRIEEENIVKRCYIQGPKGERGEQGIPGPQGPKGEDGPTTIKVGKTETLDANKDAIVENVGTDKDVILNFKIPRGEKGKDGDKLVVGKTETLDANAKARVIDTYIGNVHTLDFYIPQGFDGANGDVGPKGEQGPPGPKGDIGPQGSTGVALLEAYASLYEDNGNSYSLMPNIAYQVELSQQTQMKNVDISFTNTVKIQKAGIYKVDYFFEAKSSATADVSIEVRKENVTINGTKITRRVDNQEYVTFTGSIIVNLNVDEKIDLAISSPTAVVLTPENDTISYLTIMKIGSL